MRFLNLTLTSPELEQLKIAFSEGLNIVSISDIEMFTFFKNIPLMAIHGTESNDKNSLKKKFSYSINALNTSSNRNIFITGTNGILKINNSVMGDENGELNPEVKPDICTALDFFISSCFSPEHIQKNEDPVFEKDRLKALLINNEVTGNNFPFFLYREKLLQEKEKELTDLSRDKQLLELKRMKKEKILKEINLTERSLHKLEKRRDSILKYKTILNDIIAHIESKDKLISKTINIKKDLIELKDIKEKITSVENTLREKFLHFSDKGNDKIPDLEQIQELFNSFRDINEQVDKFYQKKKFYTGWTFRIIASMIIFSFTALLFLIFSSSASSALAITSGLSAGIAGLTGTIYYFTLRKIQPSDLLEQKKNMESGLIDLLKKNSFSAENFKTGELYEFLFQYFEDYINYRDINYELMELKKKISNSASLIEKEKKLEQINDEIENINSIVNLTIEDLDQSIHPSPDLDGIPRVIHEIDELYEENETEISGKKILIKKFEEEIDEYDKTENSVLSSELKLEELFAQIDDCREKIEHIKFLEGVFNKAAETWSTQRLEQLSRLTLEKFLTFTGNSFIKEDIADTINNVILHSGKIRGEHSGLKKYFSFSIKAALSELLCKDYLPPVFLIDPFTPDDVFADNIKKLLPELFPERQVVIISQGSIPDIKGNLITL